MVMSTLSEVFLFCMTCQVGGGNAKMQPVYVRDVTEAFLEVLKTKDSIGQTYSLAGPRVFT